MKERGEEEKQEEGESSLNLKMVEKAWIAVSLYPSSSSRFRKHLKKDPSLIIKDPRTTGARGRNYQRNPHSNRLQSFYSSPTIENYCSLRGELGSLVQPTNCPHLPFSAKRVEDCTRSLGDILLLLLLLLVKETAGIISLCCLSSVEDEEETGRGANRTSRGVFRDKGGHARP